MVRATDRKTHDVIKKFFLDLDKGRQPIRNLGGKARKKEMSDKNACHTKEILRNKVLFLHGRNYGPVISTANQQIPIKQLYRIHLDLKYVLDK